MSWKDLIEDKPETLVLPWFERDRVHTTNRTFKLEGERPPYFGWWDFDVRHRTATWDGDRIGGPNEDAGRASLITVARGYLVGDQLMYGTAIREWIERNKSAQDPNDSSLWKTGQIDPKDLRAQGTRVRFIPEGLERFQPVECGVISSSVGPTFYKGIYQGYETDPVAEYAVRRIFDDREETIEGIKGVHPALDLAFRMEVWRRNERERLEALAEQKRKEELERLALEEKRAELERKLGSGASRREVARIDINTAARAALRVGNADFLDLRAEVDDRGNVVPKRYVVRYRVDGERLACVIDDRLQVCDAGVCLVDHRTGIKGDTWFTLESLPSVIREAVREDKLVVWRHG